MQLRRPTSYDTLIIIIMSRTELWLCRSVSGLKARLSVMQLLVIASCSVVRELVVVGIAVILRQ